MKTLVIGKDFGGETSRAGKVKNWPGIKSIDGYELMTAMKEHAKSLGAEVISGEVTGVSKEGECFKSQPPRKNLRRLMFCLPSAQREGGSANKTKRAYRQGSAFLHYLRRAGLRR